MLLLRLKLNKIMKFLIIFIVLFLAKFNLCATDIDKQIAVVTNFVTTMSEYSITTSGVATTRFYDNVVIYSMRYFLAVTSDDDPAILYSSNTGSITAVLGNADFFYSFNRQLTGGTFTNPSPFLDSNRAALTESKLTAKYYQVGYKEREGVYDYAYLAFNIVPVCPTSTINKKTPPIVSFNAKFFCSDEEAFQEYTDIIAINPASSVAYFNMKGLCTTSTFNFNSGSIFVSTGTVTACDLLTGKDLNDHALCKIVP